MARLFPALLAALIAVTSAFPNNGTFSCTSEGRFPDPYDCSSYFTCIKGSDGLSAERKSCNGYAFNPDKQNCVSPNAIDNCNPTRGSRQLSSDPSLNALCTTDTFVCSDCKTVINCVDNRAFIDASCGEGLTCQTPSSFSGSATCYDKETDTSSCKCTEPNKFNSDPHNENGFVFCPLADSDPMVHRCPGKMTFDTTVLDCTNADGIPACTQGGVFANTNNCEQYYTCIQTVEGWVQKVFECDEGTMYNEAVKECSNPCDWPNPEFECYEEGRFADPKSCSNYFVCVSDPANEGSFKMTSRKCPLDYEWDVTANGGAGHCVSQGFSSCTPIVENVCTIPESYNCDATGAGNSIHGPSIIDDTDDIPSIIDNGVAEGGEDTVSEGDGVAEGGDVGEETIEGVDDVPIIDDTTGTGRFAFRPPNPLESGAEAEERAESIQNVIQLLKNKIL